MRATEVAGLVVYSTAALMLGVWLIWASRPAERARARGAAARGFPCSFRTGMLGALCEDATDKGGAFNYDRRALASLRFLTLDFTPGPNKDFRACPASLALVSASTQLGIHPDVSGTAVFGPGTTLAEWTAYFAGLVRDHCAGLLPRLQVIVLEPENMSPPYAAVLTTQYVTQNYDLVRAAFVTAGFTGLVANGVALFATTFEQLASPQYRNVWFEAYNLWNRSELCLPFAASPGCKVDFNSNRPGRGLEFPGAQCGPDYLCPTLGCPFQQGACGGRGRCDATVAYGGGVYDPGLTPDPPGRTWTPYERGAFLGTITAEYLAKPSLVGSTFGPTPPAISRTIYFPFTDASCPSLYGAVQTADDFDLFVQGFKDPLVRAEVFTADLMDSFTFGAWGVPRWLRLE